MPGRSPLIYTVLGFFLIGCAGAATFTIDEDRFYVDGEPFRIVSGSVHYQRIHPAYWEDRLLRVKSLGVNTIQTYVPWNVHEPRPGHYNFEGLGDVFSFLETVQNLDLKVLLRLGPYICAEYEFGGLPWWLQAANQVKGGGVMKLRSSDPLWLAQVDAWWSLLLPRLKRFMHIHGGSTLMVQIENEFGFCGHEDPVYLRHLVNLVRIHLGNDVQIYTTDPPYAAPVGTLPGQEVYTVVDFGPGTNVDTAFAAQALQNVPGKSPALCSEFYTGWITHWGEPMANTSAAIMVKTLDDILSYNNDSGSVNLYMAYGGSNFQYGAGANLAGRIYQPTITSYDYDCPISEAGATGQPGIGGPNKYDLIRAVFAKHTGNVPCAPVLPIPAQAHGQLTFTEGVALLDALPQLSQPPAGVHSLKPDIMEQYGQAGGFILYRTSVPAAAFADEGALLDLGAPVHDYATVFLDGNSVGVVNRNFPRNLTMPVLRRLHAKSVQLDILVHALGRVNFGCVLDMKGLQSANVLLNGQTLASWTVFPLPFDPYPHNLTFAPLGQQASSKSESAAGRLQQNGDTLSVGPVFFRGLLHINSTITGPYGHMLDTYLDYRGWNKGLVFVNGFNLGWYWPRKGPQNTQYIPGPLLHYGTNEIVLLEIEPMTVKEPAVAFVALPDFYGPGQTAMQIVEEDLLEAVSEVAAHRWTFLMQSAADLLGHMLG